MSDEKTSKLTGMSTEQMAASIRSRLRRDYRDLSPAERIKQVADLSRAMSRPADDVRGR